MSLTHYFDAYMCHDIDYWKRSKLQVTVQTFTYGSKLANAIIPIDLTIDHVTTP